MKPIFFTSDWHIGHENVIKFDSRPFSSLEDMHSTLIRRYNSTVPENGVCYFLGDMGNKVAVLREVVDQLNGIKILLRGNHDHNLGTMYNAGFDAILDHASFHINDTLVTMSHCPLLGIKREDCSHIKGFENANWYGDTSKKHLKFALEDRGQFHLHGHIHSGPGKDSKTILDRQMDVGVSAHKYTPVSYHFVNMWVQSTKAKGVK